MTIQEALLRTQGREAGMINRTSVRYAQTLIFPDEVITAAVIANITMQSGHFPGVVVLTDHRVMAACGLPGIKCTVSYPLDQLGSCKEKLSAINYKVTFSSAGSTFSMTVDPETGEKFSRHIAILNGDVEAFDAADTDIDSGILNPVLIRSKRRVRQARERERAEQMETVQNRCPKRDAPEQAAFR